MEYNGLRSEESYISKMSFENGNHSSIDNGLFSIAEGMMNGGTTNSQFEERLRCQTTEPVDPISTYNTMNGVHFDFMSSDYGVSAAMSGNYNREEPSVIQSSAITKLETLSSFSTDGSIKHEAWHTSDIINVTSQNSPDLAHQFSTVIPPDSVFKVSPYSSPNGHDHGKVSMRSPSDCPIVSPFPSPNGRFPTVTELKTSPGGMNDMTNLNMDFSVPVNVSFLDNFVGVWHSCLVLL